MTSCLRETVHSDLAEFFEHQRDPVANEMAAFPARDREAFIEHWTTKILANGQVIKRTVFVNDEVAGNVLCFEQSGRQLIGYWLGRRSWGRGLASRAVAEIVSLIPARPLHAYVAKANVASIRVLEKCGFKIVEKFDAEATTNDDVDEFLFVLSD